MQIWLGTWNVEQQFPTAQQLQAWLNHGGFASPEIIAMGFQEASRGAFTPQLGGYQLIEHIIVKGRTKTTKNSQILFVYAKNPLPANTTAVVVAAGQHRSNVSSWKKNLLPAGEYGKGAAVSVIDYSQNTNTQNPTTWRIAICSAHLDSKNAQVRRTQIGDIMNCVDLTSGGANNWGLCFFMGDLNYRLAQGGHIGLNTAPNTMIDEIRNHRHRLFLQDTLNTAQNQLNPDFNRGGAWIFPDPFDGQPQNNAYYLPTYKRNYEGTKGAEARQHAVNLPSALAIEKCFSIKVKNNIVQLSERAGQYDLGWLDRVGYCNRGNLNITLQRSGSCSDIVLSDHTCIYSLFDVQ